MRAKTNEREKHKPPPLKEKKTLRETKKDSKNQDYPWKKMLTKKKNKPF